jgi:hypothetical protein
MKSFLPISLAFGIALVPLFSALGQEVPAPEEGETISGSVINLSTDEQVREQLEVMLHSWGADGSAGEMLHGTSEVGGTFSFEDVPLDPTLVYTAMVVYQDVAYYSEPAEIADGELLAPLEISIFETTNEDEQVSIDQLHIFLELRQGGLMVAEIYAISNLGSHTVKDAVQLENETWATMEFSLPAEAANVAFPTGPAERFISTSTGFTDAQPLIPGQGNGQVIVMYVLPYEDKTTLKHALPFAAANIAVFIPHASGLSIDDQDAIYEGVETFADSASYEAYTYGPQPAGSPIEISISGRSPELVTGMQVQQENSAPSRQELALGAGVLGIALIVAGVWWWRRESESNNQHTEQPEADEAPL